MSANRASANACKHCEKPLPESHSGRVCPACLMAEALEVSEVLDGGTSEEINSEMSRESAISDSLAGTTLGPGGRYKLLQRIGEGGFGTVYMADQTAPVRRRVAVKVLKTGMDTRQVVARFEAERQALAMMDHPNIARIIDGGETDHGRPFFVMELVRGTPITEFCDEENFDTRRRLQLFIKVCGAVQHAHQKGVIHRDLKPGNILVTIEGGAEPVPKVIDFGVAKAADAQLTDKTLFTRFEQMIGTPAYMSPEQAGARASHDIDTRADIYALGVLLYELLTGTTPIESTTLKGAAFDEVRRILREDDAPRPSARLSSIELDRRTTIAKHRGAQSATLGRQLRGDLDWIVMKAIEKDRQRRYDTANALAADVERHLDDEPVSAGPPTAAYRTGKFLRRHKSTVAVAAAMVFLLVAGIAVSTWQAVRATAEKRRATEEKQRAVEAEALAEERQKEAESISEFITGMFDSAKPGADDGGRIVTVAESLRIAEKKLDEDEEMPSRRRAVLQQSIAEVYGSLGRYGDGTQMFEKAIESYRDAHGANHADTLRAIHSLAHAYAAAEHHEKAMRYFEDSIVGGAETLGLEHPDVQKWLGCLSRNSRSVDGLEKIGGILSTEGGDLIDTAQRPSESLPHTARERVLEILSENYELASRTKGPEHPDTILAMGVLAGSYHKAGRLDDALKLREQLLMLRRKVLGPEHSGTLLSIAALAESYSATGDDDQALRLREQVLQIRSKVQGAEHPKTLAAMHVLANSLASVRRPDEALAMREQVLALRRKVLGPEHPDTVWAFHHLAISYHNAGRRDEALAMREELLKLRRKVLGSEHPDTLYTIIKLADSYHDTGRRDEALAMREEVLAPSRKVLGPEHTYTLLAMRGLANSYRTAGRLDEALAMQEEELAFRRKMHGPKHSETVNTTHNLAISYHDTGRFEEALAMREEVLELCRKMNGPEHSDSLLAMRGLAISYRTAGRLDEVLAMREEILAISRKVKGPDHPDTLSAINNLALSYHDAGRRDEALAMREEVLELRRKVLGPEHPDTLTAINNLAISVHDADRQDEALAMREELVQLSRKALGSKHPDTIRTMSYLTNSLFEFGRQDRAIQMQEEALKLSRQTNGSEHPLTLKMMILLSHFYANTKRLNQALAMREEILRLRRKSIGSEHPDTLRVMHVLAVTYRDADRLDDAVELQEEAVAMSLKALGPKDMISSNARFSLAEFYEKAGRKDEALELIGFGHLPLKSDSPAVTAVLIKPTTTWRWLHPLDGVDPAETDPGFHQSFFRAVYDDSAWQSGKDSEEPTGGFGYGDEEFTGVDIGTPSTKTLGKAGYFRHRFTTDEEFTKLELRCHRDDGIIVYLDGEEVARVNMRAGEEAYRLPAEWTVGDAAETAVFRFPLEGLTLPAGEHILAISLHNTEAPSSDLRIGGITLVEVE